MELLQTLLGVMIFSPMRNPNEKGLVRLSAGTDNKGNGAVADKRMSSKFLLNAILMGISAQLELRGTRLDLIWVPRGQNIPADDLSNGDI